MSLKALARDPHKERTLFEFAFFSKTGCRQKNAKNERPKHHKGVCKKRAILAGQCAIDPRIIKSDFGVSTKGKQKSQASQEVICRSQTIVRNRTKEYAKKWPIFGKKTEKKNKKTASLIARRACARARRRRGKKIDEKKDKKIFKIKSTAL